jgi:predicted GH43/DUF377 family glycosyl hydrolase
MKFSHIREDGRQYYHLAWPEVLLSSYFRSLETLNAGIDSLSPQAAGETKSYTLECNSTISGVAKTSAAVGLITLLLWGLASTGLISPFWPLLGGITAGILLIHAKKEHETYPRIYGYRLFNNNRNIATYINFAQWRRETWKAFSSWQFSKLFSWITHEIFHAKISREYPVYALQAAFTALLVFVSAQLVSYLSGIAVLLILKIMIVAIAIRIISYMATKKLLGFLAGTALIFTLIPLRAPLTDSWIITQHAPSLLDAAAFLIEDIAVFALVILLYRALRFVPEFVPELLNGKTKFRRISGELTAYIIIIALLVFLSEGIRSLIPPAGIYNHKSYVRLVDATGQVFYYRGPAYFSLGHKLLDRHAVFDWKEISLSTLPWVIDEELGGQKPVLFLTGNPYRLKGGAANVKYIHAGTEAIPSTYNWLLRGADFINRGLEYFSWRWYLVLPSGEEIELGRAIREGIIYPRNLDSRSCITAAIEESGYSREARLIEERLVAVPVYGRPTYNIREVYDLLGDDISADVKKMIWVKWQGKETIKGNKCDIYHVVPAGTEGALLLGAVPNPQKARAGARKGKTLNLDVRVKKVKKRGMILKATKAKEKYILNAGVLALNGTRFLFARRAVRELSPGGEFRSEIGLYEHNVKTGKIRAIDREMLVPEGRCAVAYEDPRVFERDNWIYLDFTVLKKDGSYYSTTLRHKRKDFLAVVADKKGRKGEGKEFNWRPVANKRLINDGPCRKKDFKDFVHLGNPTHRGNCYALYRPDTRGGKIIRWAGSKRGLAGPWKDAGIFRQVSHGFLGPSAYVASIPERPYEFVLYHRARENRACRKHYDIRLIIFDMYNPKEKYFISGPILEPDAKRPRGVKPWLRNGEVIYTCGAILAKYDVEKSEYTFDIYYSKADAAIFLDTVTLIIKEKKERNSNRVYGRGIGTTVSHNKRSDGRFSRRDIQQIAAMQAQHIQKFKNLKTNEEKEDFICNKVPIDEETKYQAKRLEYKRLYNRTNELTLLQRLIEKDQGDKPGRTTDLKAAKEFVALHAEEALVRRQDGLDLKKPTEVELEALLKQRIRWDKRYDFLTKAFAFLGERVAYWIALQEVIRLHSDYNRGIFSGKENGLVGMGVREKYEPLSAIAEKTRATGVRLSYEKASEQLENIRNYFYRADRFLAKVAKDYKRDRKKWLRNSRAAAELVIMLGIIEEKEFNRICGDKFMQFFDVSTKASKSEGKISGYKFERSLSPDAGLMTNSGYFTSGGIMQPRPGEIVLDLLGGPGGEAINLAVANPGVKVYCLDANPLNISMGIRAAAEQGLNPEQIQFILADALKGFSLSARSIDKVMLVSHSLHGFLTEQIKVLFKNTLEVLKDEALLYFDSAYPWHGEYVRQIISKQGYKLITHHFCEEIWDLGFTGNLFIYLIIRGKQKSRRGQ